MRDRSGTFKLPRRVSIPGLRRPYFIDRINGKFAARIGTKTPEAWVNRKIANTQAYQAKIIKRITPSIVPVCQTLEGLMADLSTLVPVSPSKMTGNSEMDARLVAKEESKKMAFQARKGQYARELAKMRVKLEGIHSQVDAFLAETEHITQAHVHAYCQGRRANVEYEIVSSASVNDFRAMIEAKEQLAAQTIKKIEE